MKLNFLNVLNKKSTADEIAEQIVALETKQKQCETLRDEAKNVCKELRGKVMCGEKVNSDAIKAADKTYEEANLNLEIVAESLEELKKNLYIALEAHRDEEAKKLNDLRARKDEVREKAMRELAKAKGRLFGIAMGIFGHPEYVRRHIENNPGLSPLSSDPLSDDFNAEKDRTTAELKKPTVANMQNDCDVKTRWLETFNLEEEHQSLIKKYQDRVTVGGD